MDEKVEREQKEKKVLNVLPANKGKRFLAFLGDFFLNFILAYLLFIIAVLPLGQLFTSYSVREKTNTDNIALRSDVLKANKLLFFSDNVDKSDVLYNASFTFYCYFSYYVYEEENPANARYSQYGHKEENEIFRHYFVDIAHSESKYFEFFDSYNKGTYFTRNGNVINMVEDVKTLIFPAFDKSDTPSKDADKIIEKMESDFFYPMYSEMMNMIQKETDLFYGGYSYNQLQKSILGFNEYIKTLTIYCSFITIFLSTAVLYLIIPLANHNHKTITMMIMRLERVNSDTLEIVKVPKVIINFVYALLTSFIIAFFVPATFITIYGIFDIPILMIFGFFSILIMIVSLIFLLFNKFNMDMFDYFTRSVLLRTDTLDDIYRAKGYYI